MSNLDRVMERLSNSSTEYFEQIKIELSNYETNNNWKTVFQYLEISQLLRYGFSIKFDLHINNKDNTLRLKRWNTEYDNSRFKLGVYNLDRLAIIEEPLTITSKEKKILNSVNLEQINTLNGNSIILDGFYCKLGIPHINKNLQWNGAQ